MHPLVSRIRPSLRTAAVSWTVLRALAWLLAGRAGAVWPQLEREGYEVGGALWVVSVRGLREVSGMLPTVAGVDGSVALLAAAGEFALLVGAVALYAAARRRELPQTADRATWLWLASPVAALTLPVGPWNFAAPAALGAIWAVSTARPVAASALLAVAVGFRPELVLLAPGLAWGCWRECSPDGRAFGTWLMATLPAAAFTACVVAALGLVVGTELPMHGLYPGEGWRRSFQTDQLLATTSLMVLVLGASAVAAALIREIAEMPAYWTALALPLIVWPFLHRPAVVAAGIWLVAVPLFVALARTLEHRGVERAAFAAMLGGQWLWLVA
ncbi:MAG: hypothetical protein ABEL76_07935 [Bradymonadaceae bacterium]